MRCLGSVQLNEVVRDLMDGDFFALLQSPAPERLQGRAVSRPFADLERDDFGVEDVRHDLAPDLRLRAAPGRANLLRFDAQLGEPAQTVVHPQRRAFHGGAGKMFRGERFRGHTEENAGAVGHVWGAFAFEIRQ